MITALQGWIWPVTNIANHKALGNDNSLRIDFDGFLQCAF